MQTLYLSLADSGQHFSDAQGLRGWCQGNIRGICGDLRESRAPGAVLSHLIGHQVSNGDVSKMCYTMGSHLCFQSPHRNITIAIVLARYLQTAMIDIIIQISLALINTLCIAGSDHRQVCLLLRHYYKNQSQGSPALITNQLISLFMVNEWSLISESC